MSYSFRMMRAQPVRLFLTIGGIALCVILMQFLLSVYRGVADGSVEYIRHNTADLWVLQSNATNILRGSSILSTGHGTLLKEVPGVRSVSPVLFLLSSIKKNDVASTVYLTGYDLTTGEGGPPELVAGRNIANDDEIVLDRSFAAKNSYKVGDNLILKDDTLRVVGISSQTNMFVVQYAFVTLHRAQSQIGYPGLVTCFLVRVQDSTALSAVKSRINDELPGLEVFDRQTFLQNNMREMQSGFLPLLYTIAAIGGVVVTTILSLILSVNILERRKDFAVMKTLGSPCRFLTKLIFSQSLQLASAAYVAAVAAYFPLVRLIESLSPEVSTKTSPEQLLCVLLAIWFMSCLSALPAIRRVARIYTLEAFS